MAETLGTGWLNKNSLRNYPISQSASGLSSDGSFVFADNLFLDMKLAVPFLYNSSFAASSINPAKFYISSLKVYPQGFVFFIGCDTKPQIAVSDPVGFSSFQENMTVAIRGLAESTANTFDFSQVHGWAVLGNVDKLKTRTGEIIFTLESGRLESNVICYGPRRISGIKIFSDLNTSSLISGQVLLNSGANHRMSVGGNAADGYTVTMNAVSSDNFQEICECADVEVGPCIRSINTVTPNSNGRVDIQAGDCLVITSGTNSISISDTCAKPCCGCSELEVLVADVSALTSQLSLLQSQIGVLTGSVSSLQDVCLGSRIDATSCTPDE